MRAVDNGEAVLDIEAGVDAIDDFADELFAIFFFARIKTEVF